MGPLLSIHCLTYNHAKFIRKCLDSILMQKTNFPFEVLIHDDASTDGTAEIIKEYAKKYPDIINPVLQTENQWQKGVDINKKFIFPKIKGKYVALCEGDDYWTDENKLQKQVDFLESNHDFAVCFHPVKVVWEDKSADDSIFPTPKMRFNKTVLTLDDLLKANFIQTNSVMYRWALADGKYCDVPDGILPGDWFLHLLHAKHGKIGFLPDVMSVYRKHSGGVWAGCGETDDWFLHCGITHMRFYKEVEKTFNADKHSALTEMGQATINVLLKHKKFEELQNISDEFSDLWEQFIYSPLNNNLSKKNRKLKKKYRISLIILLILLLVVIFLATILIMK